MVPKVPENIRNFIPDRFMDQAKKLRTCGFFDAETQISVKLMKNHEQSLRYLPSSHGPVISSYFLIFFLWKSSLKVFWTRSEQTCENGGQYVYLNKMRTILPIFPPPRAAKTIFLPRPSRSDARQGSKIWSKMYVFWRPTGATACPPPGPAGAAGQPAGRKIFFPDSNCPLVPQHGPKGP